VHRSLQLLRFTFTQDAASIFPGNKKSPGQSTGAFRFIQAA
jgi:hypothetical protein